MTLHKFRRSLYSADKIQRRTSVTPLTPKSIDHNQAINMLLRACPSFRTNFENYIRARNTRLVYVAFGEFAKHLLKLHINGNTSEFNAVAEAIEYLYIHGTPYVKSATTGGLLEVIKINWPYNNVDPRHFTRYLKPVSTRYWKSLYDYYN